MQFPKFPVVFVFGVALFLLAACDDGDDDSGDVGDGAELPPAGQYTVTIDGTIELAIINIEGLIEPAHREAGVSAAGLGSGGQTQQTTGGLTIDLKDDGTFTVPELNISVPFFADEKATCPARTRPRRCRRCRTTRSPSKRRTIQQRKGESAQPELVPITVEPLVVP